MLQLSTITRLAAVSLVSVTLAACTTTGGYFSPQASVDATQIGQPAADAIAADMVGRLAEYLGPGVGTLSIKSDNSAFAVAFDKSLRGWGYAVETAASTQQGSTAATPEGQAASTPAAPSTIIPVAYTVDGLDGNVIARISTPNVELTRTYQVTTNGAVPASPLSVLQRGPSS